MFGAKSGMESMIANMIGFTPDELGQMLTDFRNMIVSTKDCMERIEAKLDIALEIGKVLENDDRIVRPNSDGNHDGGAVASIGGPTNGSGTIAA